MSRFYVRELPHMLRPSLENARNSRLGAGVRNAATCALILLDNLGRGRRSKAWKRDFEKLCVQANVVR